MNNYLDNFLVSDLISANSSSPVDFNSDIGLLEDKFEWINIFSRLVFIYRFRLILLTNSKI